MPARVMRKRVRTRRPLRKSTVPVVSRKKSYRNPLGTNLIRTIGAPSEVFVKFPYVQTTTAADTAAFVFQQFQSSLFDPDLTGVGHQPRYYDQWGLMFNKYQVLAMKAHVEFVQIDNSQVPIACAVSWSENSNSFAAADDLAETKYGRKVILQGQGAKTVASIKTYMTAKKIHGNRKGPLQQDDQQSLITTSPADMFFLNIGHQTIDGGTTTQVYKRVKITYYCRLFDQKDPGAS